MSTFSSLNDAIMADTVLNRMRSEGELCDVVLRAEGVEFRTHKIILCASSSYFLALFASGWSHPDKTNYDLPNISAQAMDLILTYIYTGQVEVTKYNVELLLPAADFLAVKGVVQLCCHFLEANMDIHNCISIRRYAQVYSCTQLRDHAHTFILQHFEQLVQASPTKEFLELSLDELSVLLDQDLLNVRREETVFDTVLNWINHAPDQRSQSVVELLPRVRLGLISAEYFLNQVIDCPLLAGYQECSAILSHAHQLMDEIYITGRSQALLQVPLCRPRLPHALLFTTSGWSEGSPTDTMETYDPRAGLWRQVFYTEGVQRAYHGSAYLDGFLFIIGGFNAVEYFNSVSKFHLLTRTWHQVAPMHYRRCYVGTTVLDGYIYALGGFDGVTRLNTAERYQPQTNQWSLIPPMRHQRSDASAATLSGKIYVCGGFTGHEILFTAECFEPQNQQWTLIAPMISARSGVGVVALNNRLFVVGGFDGMQRLSSVEIYSPETDSWNHASDMLDQRSNFGIEVLEEQIYVVGGFDGHGITSRCEVYDESQDNWSPLQGMNIRRSAPSCCIVSALTNITDYTFSRGSLDRA